MLRKIAAILFTFAFASLILVVSVFHSCNTRVFSASPTYSPQTADGRAEETDYVFVYPGGILPDSPLWYLKALRDRVWLTVTTNSMRKAELLLLFADKRLMASQQLFLRNKPGLALSTLTKAEKYLERAALQEDTERKKGTDTKSFLLTLAKASVAHIGEIEKLIAVVPDDVKPEIVKVENYAVGVYNKVKDALQSQGITAPKNPFNGN